MSATIVNAVWSGGCGAAGLGGYPQCLGRISLTLLIGISLIQIRGKDLIEGWTISDRSWKFAKSINL